MFKVEMNICIYVHTHTLLFGRVRGDLDINIFFLYLYFLIFFILSKLYTTHGLEIRLPRSRVACSTN